MPLRTAESQHQPRYRDTLTLYTPLRVCQPEGEYVIDDPEPHPNFDGIWKEALRHWLPQCLALFWPHIHAGINWGVPPTFLDKELQHLNRIVRTGTRHVDILARLQFKTGASALLLIHLEVQAGRITAAFPARMFQ
ncbi:MAG: hypothetical protein M0R28_22590 [Pigmentiphaga sp.]|nr:hypothetical protein [Pigmentiphaga sp.]